MCHFGIEHRFHYIGYYSATVLVEYLFPLIHRVILSERSFFSYPFVVSLFCHHRSLSSVRALNACQKYLRVTSTVSICGSDRIICDFLGEGIWKLYRWIVPNVDVQYSVSLHLKLIA